MDNGKKNYFFITCFLTILFPASLLAQGDDAFKKDRFVRGKDTLNYRILYPENFSRTKEYPVVLFLHGAGERGNDNQAQLRNGSDLFLQPEIRQQFPAIVIFPQAPKDDYWAKVEVDRSVRPYDFNFLHEEAPTTSLQLVMDLLDDMLRKEYVDPERIYVGGLSMGGMGTFELIGRKPEVFAAAFAICGGANPGIVEEYPPHFDMWIFHGEKDDLVPPSFSKTMARVINSKGGNAKLSLYPNDNHNSWDSALSEPFLIPWLFSKTKK